MVGSTIRRLTSSVIVQPTTHDTESAMSDITEVIEHPADYALGRTPREYQRLRTQARIWESATERLLDQIDVAPGARCLDAGCGPGETMRLLARRVGPDGAVTGIDVDSVLGALVEATLQPPVTGSAASMPSTSLVTFRSREPRTTLFSPACCCFTCRTGWRSSVACGMPSLPAGTSSCRTTICAVWR